ncbi:cytokine receptor-like factor 3 isoform X1 [Hydra vulgaris]|uniref:Cytokine receptor-like factor 3 n=1 Tax=Hydra vulgaris TaxID=6087 RepID=T2MAP5_HYDVU|nr:cytokine receptor-like factor 3 [Hydra vulgaris]
MNDAKINDMIDRCENRLSFLNNKLSEYRKTGHAVQLTSENTKKALTNHVTLIEASISRALNSKFNELCHTIDEAVAKDFQHLNEAEIVFQKDIAILNSLIIEAKKCSIEKDKGNDTIDYISQALADIGKVSSEMPIISLSFSSKLEEAALSSIEDQAADLLKLTMTGSVQIVECVERPGAIIVRWDEQEASDCESIATDNSCVVEYILQVYEDGGSQDGMFHSIYEGDEMQFTFTFAEPYKTYSFRVCQHTVAGAGVYGPWSMTKKACTTLSPHVWREEDCITESNLQLYQLSNKCRTTTKIFPESSHILRSKVASYILGQHIQFKIEEAGESSINDGIGFLSHNKQIFKQLTHSPNTAVMNTRGTIFVNGLPMVTKLPALKRGSVMLCHASRQSSGKLRVTISIDDKEVTFDWSTQSEHYDALYFACGFEHTGWQVSVV